MRKKKKKKKELIENWKKWFAWLFVEVIFVDGWQIEVWNSKIGGFFQPGRIPTFVGDRGSQPKPLTISGKGYQPNISQIKEAFKTDVVFPTFF